MSAIDTILSKGDVASGSRSRERARQLLADFKLQLGLMQTADAALDHALVSFLTEAVLGAAWYQSRCAGALRKVWFYIAVNCALVIGVPLALIGIGKLAGDASGLLAQVTAILTGILALQKSLSAWYSSQQRYASWHKAKSDLKTLYYSLVQTWTGKVGSADQFLPALQVATAAARQVIDDEQQDYFEKLVLPSFDVLDMLTSTRSTVSSFVTTLLPGAAPSTVAVMGKATMASAAGRSDATDAIASPDAAADGQWTALTVSGAGADTFQPDVMLLLTDGSVLIHNGYSNDIAAAKKWKRLTPGKDGRYETGSWSDAASMALGRQWFASGILADGRVFVIGGEYCEPAGANGSSMFSTTGEIFDPVANAWSAINKPQDFDFVNGDCNGTVLADGRVLLGGVSSAPDASLPPNWISRTAIWDPVAGTWMEAGLRHGQAPATSKTDPFEEETFALLPDGSVLAPAVRDTPKAQRYVPSLDAWVDCAPSPVNLAITTLKSPAGDTVGVYETGPAILLPSGKVFCIGGGGQTATFTPGLGPTDPGSWQKGPIFPPDPKNPIVKNLTALDSSGCLLPNGKVMVVGGSITEVDDGNIKEYYSKNPVFLIYDPQSAAAVLPALNPQPAGFRPDLFTYDLQFLVLPTGQVLCSTQTSQIYLFTPSSTTPNPAWMPANISFPESVARGSSYKLSGTQLNGLSQAVNYGDDAGMATNYPLVRLINPATGAAVYARTYDFSSMGVATKQTRQSCMVAIPDQNAMAAGVWHLTVLANGIASSAVEVTVT